MAGPLCIEWVKGWKDWHDEHPEEDPIYADVEAFVIAKQRVSITQIQRHFTIGYNRAARLVERLEAKGVISAADANGQRKVLKSTEDQEG
ncbi:DNA translocase FtsK [compost metagenome]